MTKIEIPERSALVRKVEQLEISADAKAILIRMADITAEVGKTVIAIGRPILGFIFDLARQFPNSTFGIIAGLVVGLLISSIPFVGAALASIFMPLLIALGLTRGAIADLAHSEMRDRITEFGDKLRSVAPASAN
jgi:hypothetical protein